MDHTNTFLAHSPAAFWLELQWFRERGQGPQEWWYSSHPPTSSTPTSLPFLASFSSFRACHGIFILLGESSSSFCGAAFASSTRRPSLRSAPPSPSLPALSSQGAVPRSWLPDRPPPRRGDLHGARPWRRQAPPPGHGRLKPFSSACAGLPFTASRGALQSSSTAYGPSHRPSGSDARGSNGRSNPPSTHPQGASSIRFAGAILPDPSFQGQSWPTSTAPAPPLSTDFAGDVDGRSYCHNGARGLPPAPSVLSNM